MLGFLSKNWNLKKLKDHQYEFLFNEHPEEFVSFDCETTS